LTSDTLVLRIYGSHTDYLRGRVYDHYERGVWDATKEGAPARVSVPSEPRDGHTVTEVRSVSPALRVFVPLGARHVGTPNGFLFADSVGTLRPDSAADKVVFFERGQAEFPVAPPDAADLRVPDNLLAILRPLVVEWTADALTPAEKLAAIERHLHETFTYSLEPDASGHQEPNIVHFLMHSRRGHCEYFATAMALLARVAGVPARAVGGYRVAEHNRFGGYDVVREKNAHAWVEAWLSDGTGWQTFDPTPVTEANMPRERVTLRAVLDVVAATWDRALDALGRARPWQFAVGLGLAIGLLVLVRALRARRAAQAERVEIVDLPLPSFARLEAALAALGHSRARSEPLERYSERLSEAGYADVALLVQAYGALRYGGIGDAGEIASRLSTCATEVASKARV
jgi:transglutaminase-like putative cysteine protease